MTNRCAWVNEDLLYKDYHDYEWGVPVHDDRTWFEFLVLEGAQAGLSWYTVLKKREGYRQAFDGFDPEKVALYDERKVAELIGSADIIRNRLKIRSAINNAKCFLKVREQFGSFDAYIWPFVDGKPIVNHWRDRSEVPASTPQSDALSKDLKKRGFTFVGTTICYALMQSCGMVQDHTMDCDFAASTRNTAIIPVPKLEEDCYDWWERHEQVLRMQEAMNPEIVLIGDSITHFWGGEPLTPGIQGAAEAWNAVFAPYRVLNLGFGWDRTQNVL